MRKILSIALTVSMALSLMTGCGPQTGAVMEAEKSDAYVIPQLGDDVMPISIYVSPVGTHAVNGVEYPSLITEATYQKLDTLGVNFIMGHYEPDEDLEANMTLADQFGMAFLVPEHNALDSFVKNADGKVVSYSEMTKEDQELAKNALFAKVDKYAQHKSFAGMKFWDERGVVTFEGTESARQLFHEKYSDKMFYCNLLGGGADKDHMSYLPFTAADVEATDAVSNVQAGGWSTYVNYYLDTIKNGIISYDTYPWCSKEMTINTGYMSFIEECASKAREDGRTFWNFVQTSTWDDPDVPVPSYNQMAYNLNTSLLFGAKGLSLFNVITPTEFAPHYVLGYCVTPLDLYGQETSLYYDLKAVLDDIKAVDHILMKSVYKGVLESSATKNALQRPSLDKLDSFNQVSGIRADFTYALAGCFNYQGHTALYVVNAGIEAEEVSNVYVDFNRAVKGYSIQNGKKTEFKGVTYTIPALDAGEAAMIVIE